jgi:hypothetical protein
LTSCAEAYVSRWTAIYGYTQYVKNQSQQYLGKYATTGAVKYKYKYSRRDGTSIPYTLLVSRNYSKSLGPN